MDLPLVEQMACNSIQSALALRVLFGAGGATNAFTSHSSFLRDLSCMTTTKPCVVSFRFVATRSNVGSPS